MKLEKLNYKAAKLDIKTAKNSVQKVNGFQGFIKMASSGFTHKRHRSRTKRSLVPGRLGNYAIKRSFE